MKHLFLISLLFFQVSVSSQVVLDGTNLPIIIINTFGSEINIDGRVSAEMKIISHDSGKVNYIDDTEYHYRGRVSIKNRGNTSFYLFPKKGYSFETQNTLGENDNVSLLGMPEENDWVLHNPYSDKSLMRNAITYSIAAEFMDYAPRVRYCEVVVNDEYEGVYVLTEKIKRDKNRVDISKLKKSDIDGDQLTGGYIIKIDKGSPDEVAWRSDIAPPLKEGNPTSFLFHYPKAEDIKGEQLNYIRDYINQFEASLSAPNFVDPIAGYEPYIDVESFINYSIINELTRNVDGYRLSTYLNKDRDSIDGRLKLGPVWDYNIALGNADYCHGGATKGWAWDFNEVCEDDQWGVPFWWNRLLQNPNYVSQLKTQWKELRLTSLSTKRLMSKIDSLSTLLDEGQKRNFTKWDILDIYVWPNNFVGNTYQAEVEYLKHWLNQRLFWLDQAFEQLDVLEPTTNILSLKVFPSPTIDEININFTLAKPSKSVRLAFYDPMGRLVSKSDNLDPLSESKYVFKEKFSLPGGLYFYQILIDNVPSWSGQIVLINP